MSWEHDRMAKTITLAQVCERFERAGAASYGGEAVSQLTHSLQTADLAREAGADDDLVLACLLHDLGHFWQPSRTRPAHDADDRHERFGAAIVKAQVSERIAWLIGAHVLAKRYLCTVDPSYFRSLSPVSQTSFRLQGGPLTGTEMTEFTGHRWHEEAVHLRRWDDLAKDPKRPTPRLRDFLPLLRRYFA